jgi:magnesium chelatase family protein
MTMTARVASALLQGIRAEIVTIEVQVRPGLPGTSVIGLPDSVVRERRERVKGALEATPRDARLERPGSLRSPREMDVEAESSGIGAHGIRAPSHRLLAKSR